MRLRVRTGVVSDADLPPFAGQSDSRNIGRCHAGISFLNFNKEILFGECGALLGAYAGALIAAGITRKPGIISGSVVAGTLLGASLFWLVARIYHHRVNKSWSARHLASDIAYYTPVASALGFFIYEPAIFFVARALLSHGAGVGYSVILAQIAAFTLFLGSMNIYRAILLKTGRKRL
jgi:hypothetical protein